MGIRDTLPPSFISILNFYKAIYWCWKDVSVVTNTVLLVCAPSACLVPKEARSRRQILWNQNCEPPCGCWESNTSPLVEIEHLSRPCISCLNHSPLKFSWDLSSVLSEDREKLDLVLYTCHPALGQRRQEDPLNPLTK